MVRENLKERRHRSDNCYQFLVYLVPKDDHPTVSISLLILILIQLSVGACILNFMANISENKLLSYWSLNPPCPGLEQIKSLFQLMLTEPTREGDRAR